MLSLTTRKVSNLNNTICKNKYPEIKAETSNDLYHNSNCQIT